MDYKEKFYQNYTTSHILHRKGDATLNDLRRRSIVYHKQFGKFLPQDKGAKIIDLGCGNGSVTWWLQHIGFGDSWGIDISNEQIEIGKKLGVKNLYQGNIKEYLKEIKSFYDVIFARDILEHFYKDEIQEILCLCHDSLKAGGVLIIQAPNAESPFSGRIRYGDFTHEISFTSFSLSQLLKIVGFGRIELYSTEPKIHGIKSFVRYLLWKIIEAFYKSLLFVEIGRANKIVTQGIISVSWK